MIRKVIQIDEEKCNGCGLCANACHEGAIGIVAGKAKLLRDDYCDGMGDCLPSCPMGAITFVEREAAAYNEAAVAAHKEAAACAQTAHACPGSQLRHIQPKETESAVCTEAVSRLTNWPVQIKLAPVRAPYFDGAKLLVAADCTAYTYARFHEDFIKGKAVLVGCPKLDSVDYSAKLSAILENNSIRSVTVVRMEVPCCGGLEFAVQKALQASGKCIPWQVFTISIDGKILED